MTERIHSVSEIASDLGISRHRVHAYVRRGGGPPPDFSTQWEGGPKDQLFWTTASVEKWRQFLEAQDDAPRSYVPRRSGDKPPPGFSDHSAINRVGRLEITWRLWWRPGTGGADLEWWFSTPVGWYVSSDEGTSWRATGLQTRPEGRYVAVSHDRSVVMPEWKQRVLNGAEVLRVRIQNAMAEMRA